MNNQMRVKFEQTMLREDFIDEEVLMGFDGEHYIDDVAETAWKAWQAALAASQTCVAKPELPPDAFKEACMEWSRKTDWVQEQISTFPITALGMHRADVMREEIERLRAALNVSGQTAQAAEPQIEGSPFPPMPFHVYTHPKIGKLYDRLALQLYAMKYADSRPAPETDQKPIAYLRFRAAQQWSGIGGHDIEHNEWLETCHAHEIGDDKQPAFPVYPAPQPSQVSEQDRLKDIATKLRRAGADIPAPHHDDAIKGATINGLSIALLLVDEAIATQPKPE